MKISSVRIKTRLALGFGVTLMIMVAIASAAVIGANQATFAVSEMNRLTSSVRYLDEALLWVRQARVMTWYYIATGDAKALDDRSVATKHFLDTITALQAQVKDQATTDLTTAFADDASEFLRRAANLTDLKIKNVPQTAPDFVQAMAAVKESAVAYAGSNRKAVDYLAKLSDAAHANADQALSHSSMLSLVLGSLGVLTAFALAFVVGRSIAVPLSAMASAIRALADGDLSVMVPALSHTDEIGDIAKAVDVFKENGLKLKGLEKTAALLRDATEADRAANEAARADMQRAQEAVVTSLANGLDRLAKGDLTRRLDQAFPGEYEKLRADFNATARSLQDTLGTIFTATAGISTGSDQIAEASDDLSRRTEQQAAGLEETAAALNVITQTVKTMAANAGDAAKVVVTTRSAAESSGAIVYRAVGAMGKIKESSRKITDIIGVIDEIAFQTNLLALNAGVEAARAGDAGRGFAVVASEVRGLAQRSAEAAKEIKALISASTVEVENGVDLVDQTGIALRGIIDKVAEMDSLVRQISASAQEQATGIAEINTAVGHMDQIVQQNAAMVEESTAAAHALKSETQDLSAMVGRFDIGDTRNGGVAPGRAAPARLAAAQKQAPAKLAKMSAAPRATLKTTSATLRKPETAPEKDWEEF